MSAQPHPLVAEWLAKPKEWRITVSYQDGRERTFDVATRGQAENYATGERRKIGRDLIDRLTNAPVRVIAVTITPI